MAAVQEWMQQLCMRPEVWRFVSISVAGLLGSVVNLALEERALVMPRYEDGRLHLGFLGNLAICIAVAHLVDQNFQAAFVASLCGTATLRAIKLRIEQTFEAEIQRIRGERDE